MNKKGNIFLGVILSVSIWISGILAIPFIIDVIDPTRVSLDCTNTAISFGTKMLCLTIDGVIPYIIWGLISLVLGLMAGRSR